MQWTRLITANIVQNNEKEDVVPVITTAKVNGVLERFTDCRQDKNPRTNGHIPNQILFVWK